MLIKNIMRQDYVSGKMFVHYAHKTSDYQDKVFDDAIQLDNHQDIFFWNIESSDVFDVTYGDIITLSSLGYYFEYVHTDEEKKKMEDNIADHVTKVFGKSTVVLEWNGKKLQITGQNLQIKEL